MDRHGKGSERDHLVSVVDEPPHAGVALVLARELDALRDHSILYTERSRAGAGARDPIADRRVEPVGLVLLLRELRDPRRPRAGEDDPDVVVSLLQLLRGLERIHHAPEPFVRLRPSQHHDRDLRHVCTPPFEDRSRAARALRSHRDSRLEIFAGLGSSDSMTFPPAYPHADASMHLMRAGAPQGGRGSCLALLRQWQLDVLAAGVRVRPGHRRAPLLDARRKGEVARPWAPATPPTGQGATWGAPNPGASSEAG